MSSWLGVIAITCLSLVACTGTTGATSSSTASSALSSPHSPAKLVAPEDVAVDRSGRVFFSDFGGNRVFQLLPQGNVRLVAGTGTSGETGDGGPAVDATLQGPAGLAFNKAGELLIADHDGGRIRRIDSQGIITTFAVISRLPPLSYPVGLAIDSDGSVWVAEEGNEWVRSVDDTGTDQGVAGSPILGDAFRPKYPALDSAGTLYVSDGASIQQTGCRIFRFGQAETQVIAGTGKCGYSGDGGPATAAQLDDPNGLAFDAKGNLYFADSNNERIRRIDKNGIITTVAGTGAVGTSGDHGPATKAKLASPFGIAIAPGGLLYIAEGLGKRIRVVNLSSGIITTAAA
jgi:sugar lactone lactonase YvrE